MPSAEAAIAEAFGRAWHPIGCANRNAPYDSCRYRVAHEKTGRAAIVELWKIGYRIVVVDREPETVPLWGEAK